jgi:F-type H+-transporting ATPase subunit gamma
MPMGKQAIKRRIRSVQATKKITQAMELIAISKYQKQKALLERNKDYANTLLNMVSDIASRSYVEDVFWLNEKEDTNPCVMLITSDLGLCGGYNSNVLKIFKQNKHVSKSIVIGHKGIQHTSSRGFDIIPLNSEGLTTAVINDVMSDIYDQIKHGEITSIHVIYTEFINSVTFEPQMVKLYPFTIPESTTASTSMNVETLFEPSGSEILNQLIPMTISSSIYRMVLSSKAAEQASRRLAMENATDNAEDIIENLTLKFNQSRQAAITQEISEIVAGADAL